MRDCNINYIRVLFLMIQDEKLKKLVEQNGTEDWKVIANFLPVGGYCFLFPVLVATLYQRFPSKEKRSGCSIVTV